MEILTVPSVARLQKRAHNFSAGAAMFDTHVMTKLQADFLSHNGSGMGIFVSRVFPIRLVKYLRSYPHDEKKMFGAEHQ